MEFGVGSIVDGKVTGITNFGAFISLPEGKSGLVHISEIAHTYVSEVSEHLAEGQEVKVKVIGIDQTNRINLSIKKATEPPPRPEGGYDRPRQQGGPPRERQEGNFQRGENGARQGGYQQRDGGSRQGGYQQRDGGARQGGYQQRDGESRQGGYQQRDGGARQGGYQQRDGGARQGGYQQRDGESRQGGYQQRDGGSYQNRGGEGKSYERSPRPQVYAPRPAPKEPTDFEDKLKSFMQSSDSKLAEMRHIEKKGTRRGRK